MKFLGIIPARYASTRFPGKPLADLGGKSMIRRVYESAFTVLHDVVVATDDPRINDEVLSFGGKAVMTSPDHRSGTDRCAEALDKTEKTLKIKFDVIINIQGDEPFIKAGQIRAIQSCFDNRKVQIATLIKKIEDSSVIFDPNRPKVVIDKSGFALYFSRSPIPHIRGAEDTDWIKNNIFYQHIGMYAYTHQVLREISKLPEGNLEKAESLEQLRWLENGFRIKTALTEFESIGIDTPEDLQSVRDQGLT